MHLYSPWYTPHSHEHTNAHTRYTFKIQKWGWRWSTWLVRLRLWSPPQHLSSKVSLSDVQRPAATRRALLLNVSGHLREKWEVFAVFFLGVYLTPPWAQALPRSTHFSQGTGKQELLALGAAVFAVRLHTDCGFRVACLFQEFSAGGCWRSSLKPLPLDS